MNRVDKIYNINLIFDAPELLQMVYLFMDFKDILAFEQTSRNALATTGDQMLWKALIRRDYSDHYIADKPSSLSFRDQYISFVRIEPSHAIENDRYDLLKYIIDQQLDINSLYDKVIIKGSYLMIVWLQEMGVTPAWGSDLVAIAFGRLDVLKWMEINKFPLLRPDMWIDDAIKNRNYTIIEWLLSKGHRPSPATISHLICTNQFNCAEWFINRGFQIPNGVTNLAVSVRNYEALNYLFEKQIVPNTIELTDVLIRREQQMIAWVREKGITIDVRDNNGNIVHIM